MSRSTRPFPPLLLPLLLGALCPLAAWADTFQGIEPLDTLAEVRAKIPDATLSRFDSLSNQAILYRLAAPGIQGVVMIGFADWRGNYERQLRRALVPIASALDDAKLRQAFERWQTDAQASDQQALRVMWLNWVPAQRLPPDALQAQYGKPSRCTDRFNSSEQTCEWDGKGIVARLASDRTVASVRFMFTRQEYLEALAH